MCKALEIDIKKWYNIYNSAKYVLFKLNKNEKSKPNENLGRKAFEAKIIIVIMPVELPMNNLF